MPRKRKGLKELYAKSRGGQGRAEAARQRRQDQHTERVRRRRRFEIEFRRFVPNCYAGPAYTRSRVGAAAGGENSSATVSPRGFTEVESDADSNLPSAIKTARRAYSAKSFKAGHLLNAQFGGSGTDSKNLTILTAAANGSHKAFDNPLKEALRQLKKAFHALWESEDRQGRPLSISNYELGVSIRVEVDTTPWGTASPDKYIFKQLLCSASLWCRRRGPGGQFVAAGIDDVVNDIARGRASECRRALESAVAQIKAANDNGHTIANTK